MNIEFHYYAVLYLAVKAGFSQTESQRIAEISQFVGDCSIGVKRSVDETDLTAEIKNRGLYSREGEQCVVRLPKTAPLPMSDPGWQADWKDKDRQKQTLIPFHYFPPFQLRSAKDEDNYRVAPITSANAVAHFEDLWRQAQEQYKATQNDESLIRLGLLCHVLADTFSNQGLTGFEHWANRIYLMEVGELSTGRKLQNTYNPADLWKHPAVGHARLGSCLDDVGINGVFYQASDEREGLEEVDPLLLSTQIFDTSDRIRDAGQEIFNRLLLCQNETPEKWRQTYLGTYGPTLTKMMAKWHEDASALPKKWADETRLTYAYDAQKVQNCLIQLDKAKPEAMFSFMIAADDIRKAVCPPTAGVVAGEKTCAASDEGGGHCKTVRPSVAERPETDYEISILLQKDMFVPVITVKMSKKAPVDLTVQLFRNNEQISSCNVDYPNPVRTLKAELGQLSLLEGGNEYKVKVSLNSQGIAVKSFYIPDFYELVSIKTHAGMPNPCVVDNGRTQKGNLIFPDNVPYKNHEGRVCLDVFLPLDFYCQAGNGLQLLEVLEASASLHFPEYPDVHHCKNPRFNSAVILSDQKSLRLTFAEEWKNHIPAKVAGGHVQATVGVKLRVDVKYCPSPETAVRIPPMRGVLDFAWTDSRTSPLAVQLVYEGL